MSEPQVIEQARTAVERILAALAVTRVVCVDDTYAEAPSVEEVLAVGSRLARNMLRDILPELGESIPEDADVLNQQIRYLWKTLDDKVRIERTKRIFAASRLQDGETTDDIGDASILSELIPQGRLVALSPKQWDTRREELLKEDAGSRTLFLFDQDLSETGGDVQGGMKIIASLLAREDPGNLICGLLTHTVTPENQPEKWVELSQSYGIPRDHFLVVPKQYLSKDPVFFAQLLKLVALSPDFRSLKEKTKEIMAAATAVAAVQVDGISIYDLDHIVFRVSAAEGLWEPDMLFRLHSLFHRLESRRLAHEKGELEAIARRLRSVSHIPTQAVSRPVSSAWKLQQRELYESADHLNQNHLPLELGDIFAKTGTGSTKFFVLLAQPCDLMVRSDGRRKPELVHVPLAEIVGAAEPAGYFEEMPYFGDDVDKNWFVKLKQVHQVKTCVLDLCVFSNEGLATSPINDTIPEGIRPSWTSRHAILAKAFGKVTRRIELMSCAKHDSEDAKKTKDAMRSQLSDAILYEGLFKGEIAEQNGQNCIRYNCRRTGRLARERAFALLMAYTGCLSRPAFDRDFGCTLPDAGDNG